MAYGIKPGEVCKITKPVVVDGVVAFDRGDVVTITAVSPDPACPGRKFVTFSEDLQKEVKLSGNQVRRTLCPECHYKLGGDCTECDACGWKSPEREHEEIKERIRDFQRTLDRSRYNNGRRSFGWRGYPPYLPF